MRRLCGAYIYHPYRPYLTPPYGAQAVRRLGPDLAASVGPSGNAVSRAAGPHIQAHQPPPALDAHDTVFTRLHAAVAVYFPITFSPPEGDPHGITAPLLEAALEDVHASHPLMLQVPPPLPSPWPLPHCPFYTTNSIILVLLQVPFWRQRQARRTLFALYSSLLTPYALPPTP